MIRHFFSVALRNFLKYKTQSVISIVGLAVGLLCFSLCSYLFRYWLAQDEAFPNYKRIAEITLFTEDGRLFSGSPARLAPDMQNRNFKGVERITCTTYNRMNTLNVEVENEKVLPFDIYMMETDTNFISVFGLSLIRGNLNLINTQPNTLVITESLAGKIFKKRNPIGSKVYTPDQKSYTIQGVIKDIPVNNSLSSHPVEALAVSVQDGKMQNLPPGITGCLTYALLSPGSNSSILDSQFKEINYQINIGHTCNVVSFPLGKSKLQNASSVLLYGFMFFIGFLVLLSAVMNYFSFTVGTFFNRLKEFGIRKSLGSGKWFLFMLLFSEIVLSLVLTGLITLCLTELLFPSLQFSFYRIKIDYDILTLLKQELQYILVCVGVAVLVCGVLSVRLNKLDIQVSLQNAKHRIRNFMLGVQFFICLFFLSIGLAAYCQSALFSKQLISSLSEEEKERTYFIRMDYPQFEAVHDVVVGKLKGNSKIQDLLQVNHRFTEGALEPVRWDNREMDERVCYIEASPNFLSFMNLSVLQENRSAAEQSIMIDRQLADRMKGKDPFLESLQFRNYPSYPVNAIIQPVTTAREFCPLVVAPLHTGGNCYIKIRKGEEKEVLLFVKNIMKELLPESIPVEIISLKEECNSVLLMENTVRNIFLFFGVCCLVITLLGVYASISLDTERRQKEVAIRKINGATTKSITYLFSKLYIKLLVINTMIVFPLVWILINAFVKGWTVRFNFNTPYFWLSIFLTVASIVFITIIYRIMRIARMNPAEIIKSE